MGQSPVDAGAALATKARAGRQSNRNMRSSVRTALIAFLLSSLKFLLRRRRYEPSLWPLKVAHGVITTLLVSIRSAPQGTWRKPIGGSQYTGKKPATFFE